MKLEILFLDLVSQVESENNIKVKVVGKEVFKAIDKNSDKGLIHCPDYNKNVFYADIYIDSSLSAENQINVLLHEYGHALFYYQLGKDEIFKWRGSSLFDFDVENEYAAYKFQLSKIKEVEQEFGQEILQNTIKEFKEIYTNPEVPLHYREALKKVFIEFNIQ